VWWSAPPATSASQQQESASTIKAGSFTDCLMPFQLDTGKVSDIAD